MLTVLGDEGLIREKKRTTVNDTKYVLKTTTTLKSLSCTEMQADLGRVPRLRRETRARLGFTLDSVCSELRETKISIGNYTCPSLSWKLLREFETTGTTGHI